MPRPLVLFVVTALALACGQSGRSSTAPTFGTVLVTPSPPQSAGPTNTIAAPAPTPTTELALTSVEPCATAAAPQPGNGDEVIVNADGDGVPDRLTMFADPSSSSDTDNVFYLELVIDGRAVVSVQASLSTNVRVAPIGGYDVNGDGRDELFAATGSGAYTTWIDVFEFDPLTCTLVRLVSPDPHRTPFSPQFTVGASVGNGSGLECADGALISTRFSRFADEPLVYHGQRSSYRIVGTQLDLAGQTSIEFDAEGAQRLVTFTCGHLQLPR
jgi:hypothetical protein